MLGVSQTNFVETSESYVRRLGILRVSRKRAVLSKGLDMRRDQQGM